MTTDDIKAVTSCIETLISKEALQPNWPEQLGNPFDLLLLHKLRRFHEKISSDQCLQKMVAERAPHLLEPVTESPHGVQLLFLDHCISLLVLLKALLDEASTRCASTSAQGVPPLPPSSLGVLQQKTVQGLLQFVVAIGIYPNLLPGVGVPLGKRTEQDALPCVASPVPLRRHRGLVVSVRTLLACVENAALRNLIYHRHLVDLLAALLQLCYAPVRKIPGFDNGGEHDSDMSNHPSISSQLELSMKKFRDQQQVEDQALIAEMLSDRKLFLADLQCLLENAYQPLVVREVLLILSRSSLQRNEVGSNPERVPRWLKSVCGQLLTQCLLRKEGLSRVLCGVFDACSVDSSGNIVSEKDWEKYEAFATIVARIPGSGKISPEGYYEKLAPQVAELLSGSSTDKVTFRVACGITGAMLEARPCLTSRLLLRKLFQPLLNCMLQDGPMLDQTEVIATENEIGSCVELVHKIVCNIDPGHILLDALVPIFPILFEIAVFTENTVSYLRSLCEEILSVVYHSQPADCATSLLHWCLFGTEGQPSFGKVRPDVCIALGSSGGVQALHRSSLMGDEEWAARTDQMGLVIAAIFEQGASKDSAVTFFLSLLKKLTTAVAKLSSDERGDANISPTLQSELNSQELRQNLVLLHLVGNLAQDISERLLENAPSLLQFVVETLNRVIILKAGQESTVVSETTFFCLTLLGLLIPNEELRTERHRKLLQECLPILGILGASHSSVEMRNLAQQLQVAVATQGVAGLPADKSGQRPQCSSGSSSVNSSTDARAYLALGEKYAAGYGIRTTTAEVSRQERASPTLANQAPQSTTIVEEEARQRAPGGPGSSSAFEQVWRELHDGMVPIRGHAFIGLRRLLEEGDAETLGHADEVLEACQAGIQEEDSYVYLSAIHALAALVERDLDGRLPWLAEQVALEHLSVEARLNLGEVFLRVCKQLGDIAPKYRDLLVNCFLGAAKHSDPVVRSSAVSNLGELCGKLGYSFGTIMQEILACLRGLIRDPVNHVGRASVLALSCILKGMGPKLFQVMPHEVRDIYRDLKHIYQTTSDDVIRLQAQQAIDELSASTREFLKAQPQLEKQIKILDLPGQ